MLLYSQICFLVLTIPVTSSFSVFYRWSTWVKTIKKYNSSSSFTFMNFCIKNSSDQKSETRGKKRALNFNLATDQLLLAHIRVYLKTGRRKGICGFCIWFKDIIRKFSHCTVHREELQKLLTPACCYLIYEEPVFITRQLRSLTWVCFIARSILRVLPFSSLVRRSKADVWMAQNFGWESKHCRRK